MNEKKTLNERREKKYGNSNRTESYHLNRILCCLSIFCMKDDCTYSFTSALAIGIHSMRFPKKFKCKKTLTYSLAEERKKMHIKICFWFNLCKEHKYGNKTSTTTNTTQLLSHSFFCTCTRLAMPIYKRIQWIKIEKIIINRISSR